MKAKKVKMRIVEVMICTSNGGTDCGSWATNYVEIPAKTKVKNIETESVKAAYDQLSLADRDDVVHVAVYHIPEPTDETISCRLCNADGVPGASGWVEVKDGYICDNCSAPMRR